MKEHLLPQSITTTRRMRVDLVRLQSDSARRPACEQQTGSDPSRRRRLTAPDSRHCLSGPAYLLSVSFGRIHLIHRFLRQCLICVIADRLRLLGHAPSPPFPSRLRMTRCLATFTYPVMQRDSVIRPFHMSAIRCGIRTIPPVGTPAIQNLLRAALTHHRMARAIRRNHPIIVWLLRCASHGPGARIRVDNGQIRRIDGKPQFRNGCVMFCTVHQLSHLPSTGLQTDLQTVRLTKKDGQGRLFRRKVLLRKMQRPFHPQRISVRFSLPCLISLPTTRKMPECVRLMHARSAQRAGSNTVLI